MRLTFVLCVAIVAVGAVGCGGSGVCDNDALATGCTAGSCRISSTTHPLPNGATATIAEVPVPSDLSGDVLGNSVCDITLPAGANTGDIRLEVKRNALPTDSVLFKRIGPSAGKRILATVSENAATGVLADSGIYGVTRDPQPWSVDQVFGSDTTLVVDEATMLRNVSANATVSATFAGSRLFIGNGNRVLVFGSLTPLPPTLPATVIGQPDINTTLSSTTGALTPTPPQGVWSDGTRLAISQGNRILIWNKVPTTPLEPADLVLGQPDFVTGAPNTDGISAASLYGPGQIDFDGTHFVTADTFNARVLVWNGFPSSSTQPADYVVGQPDFISSAPFSGSTPLYSPFGAMLTPQGLYVSSAGGPFSYVGTVTANNPSSAIVFGYLYALTQPGTQVARGAFAIPTNTGLAERDATLFRINITKTVPTTAASADIQLGQPDRTRVVAFRWAESTGIDVSRVNASNFGNGVQLGRGPSALLVPDAHRLLIWDHFPTYQYEPASYVFGQPGFATNEPNDFRSVGPATLASPADISTNGAVTAVADKGNNRVLLFNTAQLGGPTPTAYAAVGQPDLKSFVANFDMVSPTMATLSGPEGVCVDGKHLVVADTENHRVLIWNTIPTQSGVAADIVLGQGQLNAHRPNRGRGDVGPIDGYSDAELDGFFYPTGVACDGTHLAVADRLNHRILLWSSFPNQASVLPDKLIGQQGASAIGANRGNGWATPVADGLDLPMGISFDGTSLWVADSENNRVVRWDDVFGAPHAGAFFGQPSGTAVTNPNYVLNNEPYTGTPAFTPPATTSTSILRPRSVLATSNKIIVTEMDSNRVHVLDKSTGASLAVIGQPDTTTPTPYTNGVSAASLGSPAGLASDGTNLLVVDSKSHRVLGFPLVALSNGASAAFVIGQATMSSSGFNASSQAAQGALAQPHGLIMHAGKLYVADTANNRVLTTDPNQAPWTTLTVYGQPNDTLALPNAGGQPSASTLNRPQGVFVDDAHVVIADTGNNRVLIYGTSTNADMVLGQTSMSSITPNSTGPSASTLHGPAGVCGDGTRLAVADTANHRVLVWNSMPSTSGQPADIVLGQADMAQVQSNRGANASAGSMSFPTACLFDAATLYVADSGNNRVLAFRPISGVGNADAVFGQPDFTTRTAATTFDDLAHMAGPVALSTDGGSLYVVDRDLGRVLILQHDGSTFAAPVAEMGGIVVSALHASGGISAARSGMFTSQLYVSDTNASHVPRIVSVSRLRD